MSVTLEEERKSDWLFRSNKRETRDQGPLETVGQRIKARRLELRMTQEQVAKLCHLTQKNNSKTSERRAGDIYPLSRSAYCMYETDSVTPVLDAVLQIANALKTDPAWLAFGIGNRRPVQVIGYRASVDEFSTIDIWNIPEEWLQDTFNLAPEDVALVQVQESTLTMKQGDIAIIQRGAEPNRHNGEFAYGLCNGDLDDTVHLGGLTRQTHAGNYKVFEADRKSYVEADPIEFKLLGKVIGKVSAS